MTWDQTARLLAITGLGLALGAPAASAATDVGECGAGPGAFALEAHPTMFRLDGADYQESDLPVALQQSLFDARLEHYKKQLAIIDEALLKLDLERRAEESGKTEEALIGELIAVLPPDDGAVQDFYEANKARIGYPLEQVRDQIRQMLDQRAKQAKRADVVAEIKRRRSFEVALAKPIAPVVDITADGFPSKGSPEAKVTVVEFADYQCPHCKTAANALRQTVERFGDKVRVVFMDFPVNRSGISRAVAEGAVCADQQGQFWPYHDLAFTRQAELSRDSAGELAQELGMDIKAFRACLDSSFPRERVAKSEGEANRLGVSSTPTLFLNGRRLHLHDLETELPKAIEEALATEGS